MSTYTGRMAKFIAETRFEDLSPEVVHQAKLLILDVVGCAMSGYSHDRGMISREVVKSLGGSEEASIIGDCVRTSCTSAAYANSNMASALDNEETFMNFAHFSSNTVFSALALAERENSSGKELIRAVAIGYEVGARLMLSTGYGGDIVGGKVVRWPVVGHPYPMSGAAAACSILKLGENDVFNALGIEGHYSPSPSLQLWTGNPRKLPLIKYHDNGWMAWGGIMSALLAKKGYTSYSTGILDGEAGYWKIYGAKSCDFDVMVEGLGKKWWMLETSFKPWPSCRYTHHPLTALSRIISKHKIDADEVQDIKIKGSFMWSPQFHYKDPELPLNTQFSAPHVLAMLMLKIPPGVDWHRPEIVSNSKVKDLRNKVTIEIDPEVMNENIGRQIRQFPRLIKEVPTTVEVSARGRVFSETVKYAKGDPWDPEFAISDEELKDKFRLNASALFPLSLKWGERIEDAIGNCLALEEVQDITEFTKLIVNQ